MNTYTFGDEEDIIRRAFAAWFRSGGTDQPASESSLVEDVGDKHYATLRNYNGVLACYRITNQGQLKRLKRWPKEIMA